MKTLFKLILIILISGNVYADNIIDSKSAAKLLKSQTTQLISVRTIADYQKVHIPGAINLDHNQLYNTGAILKNASELGTILGSLGVNSSKHLIIYDDGSMKTAGRVYWIFKYLGVTEVSIIDGGMKGWRMSRLPVTKNPTSVTKANFSPKVQSKYLADKGEVTSLLNSSSTILVDVRSEEEYGDKSDHIPGAVNIPHTDLLNANGTMKSVDDLKTLFASKGVNTSKKVILYCQTSVRAGIVFAALQSRLGYTNVKVYDGAFAEWSGEL